MTISPLRNTTSSTRVFEGADANLKQVKEHAAIVQAGPRAETIEGAAAQVARARAGLRAGQANAIETKRREQDIVARQSDIERAKSQIALIDSQLADTIAVSPINGIVLVKAADVGEVLAPGTSVVTVGDIDHPGCALTSGNRISDASRSAIRSR